MKILKKIKIAPITICDGDTVSVTYKNNNLIQYKHKGKDIIFTWVAIFNLQGGICGGLFPKKPK